MTIDELNEHAKQIGAELASKYCPSPISESAAGKYWVGLDGTNHERTKGYQAVYVEREKLLSVPDSTLLSVLKVSLDVAFAKCYADLAQNMIPGKQLVASLVPEIVHFFHDGFFADQANDRYVARVGYYVVLEDRASYWEEKYRNALIGSISGIGIV